MIDDVYTRGMYFLRVHVKAPVDLYRYHSKARTLLIFYIYISHVTRVQNTVPYNTKIEYT